VQIDTPILTPLGGIATKVVKNAANLTAVKVHWIANPGFRRHESTQSLGSEHVYFLDERAPREQLGSVLCKHCSDPATNVSFETIVVWKSVKDAKKSMN